MPDIKAVIFDWGKTLWDNHDPAQQRLLEGAGEIIAFLKTKYRLGLVSLTLTTDTVEQRWQKIKASGLEKSFDYIAVVDKDKDAAFQNAVAKLGVTLQQIAIIDDRTIRGIRWGNQHGCTTIWLQKGKFADELPNQETGQPTYTIHELRELKNIL